MDYKEVLDYLFSQLPMYQRTGKAAYKANLDNTIALDIHLGFPHRKFKSIHVAGTNGKGSVSHIIASVLQAAGYKVGLYTSPHLRDFRERVRVNGVCIPKGRVIDFVENHKVFFELIKPSFFEMTVALAFDYFAKELVDIAVIEVGLGGRLDSTNIISPELSVITNISYDHMDLLGDSLQKIAREKAGIIKPEVPVVIGELQQEIKDVFVDKAIEENAPLFFATDFYSIDYSLQGTDFKQQFNVYSNNAIIYKNLKIDLMGIYQRKNIITVLKSLDVLMGKGYTIKEEDMFRGIENVAASTGLMGRWQVIGHNPLVVCDTGHNVNGIEVVMEQVKSIPYHRLHIIFGVVEDKDINNILQLLPREAIYYFTKASIPRALDENTLAKQAGLIGLMGATYPSVNKAVTAAKLNAGKEDFIFIGGSTFVVAEVV